MFFYFEMVDWAMRMGRMRRRHTYVLYMSQFFLRHMIIGQSKSQTISSYWIIMLHWMLTNTYKNPHMGTSSVSYTHQSHTPTYPHLKLPQLRYESMYQSSESRWDRNPLIDLWLQSKCTEAGLPQLQKTQGDGTMGDNCGRESRGDYISDSAGFSAGGAGGAQERTHGVVFRELTQTDRGQ